MVVAESAGGGGGGAADATLDLFVRPRGLARNARAGLAAHSALE